MRDIARWEPSGNVSAFQGEMQRMLERFFGDGGSSGPARWAPAADIEEGEDSVVITCELPGVAEDDIEITFEDGVLSITGEREHKREVKKEHYSHYERSYGAFRRSFRLPADTPESGISAEMDGGVLTVTVPKAPEREPRRIEVAAGAPDAD